MKKILITGIKGCVGTIINNSLKIEYEITGYDIPEYDVSDYSQMKELIHGFDAIVHLAMDPEVGFMNENYNPDDLTMVYNLYKIAKDNGIPRIIMFSSIHADDYIATSSSQLLTTNTLPVPDSPYGAYKVYMESLGRYYAKKGLEVICIRLGGVTPEDSKVIDDEPDFDKVYLSHRDLLELVRKSIEGIVIPNNYELLYAVSNNKRKVHDTTNSLGWVQQDSA